jgi:hypothetical protein
MAELTGATVPTTWGDVRRGAWVEVTRGAESRGGSKGTWRDVAHVVRWERDGGQCLVTLEMLPSPGSRHGRGSGGLRTATYRADTPVRVIGSTPR